MPVQKIAVLGGGIGSLATIFKLTSDPDWKSKYDITLYHMGWRLGGKGVSGRNLSNANRIEEHGLHLWFGFYDNAFNMIQEVYEANDRPSDMPLSTWEEAFTGYNMVCLEEHINGEWIHWPIELWTNKQTPGYGDGPHPTPGEYFYKILDLIKDRHKVFHEKKSDAVKANIEAHKASEHHGVITRMLDGIVKAGVHAFEDVGAYMIEGAMALAKKADHGMLHKLIAEFKHWLHKISEGILDKHDHLRQYFIIADLGVVTISGMIADKVVTEGFDVINIYDYREWLGRHHAADVTLNSALVQAVYGLVFGGDRQYTFEAGTALRGLLRLGLTFKGHVYYRMMAGMGDVITAPMYEVLMKRGVKVEYFHRITNISLDDSKQNVGSITMDVQATLKPEYEVYDPFITVNGLPCWPNEPNYEQLVQGDTLQTDNIDLESYYCPWDSGIPNKVLQAGVDFDKVVLGISIGALPTIASELIEHSKEDAWKNMVKYVVPVSTIAYQLWMKPNAEQLGWPFTKDGLALLGSYQEPYDTMCDMSDLIIRESWPADHNPHHIAYFCGPAPQPYADKILANVENSDFSDQQFPQQQKDMAKSYALDYLNTLTQHIWPRIWENQESFDFEQLVDIHGGTGQARFDSQYFRANIDPTELYVMSFTGSSQYRIKTDETGYDNLLITGDWIDNGFNAGCIEATVMAGLQTARAISGVWFDIPGENDI